MNKNILFFGPYPNPITGQSISFKETYENYNNKKILIDTTRYGSNKILNSLYSIYRVIICFFSKRFDTVYFTCTRSLSGAIKDFVLLILSFIFNKRVVCHLHGADFKSFIQKNIYFHKIIKLLYNKIDNFIVLTPSMKDQFDFVTESKIKVVENSYPLEFDNINIEISEKSDQIVYLSNIITSKGIFEFLDSASSILRDNSNIIIKIAGKIMSDEFNDTKNTRRLFFEKFNHLKKMYGSRIDYLGVVTGIKKSSLLQNSSVFVLPTFYKTEAFPISIIEAMRFGNAIITTNHNYLSDFISESNGFLIQKNSSESLLNAINILMNNKPKLYSIQNFNILISKKNYSPKIYNKKINAILNGDNK